MKRISVRESDLPQSAEDRQARSEHQKNRSKHGREIERRVAIGLHGRGGKGRGLKAR